MPGHASVSEFAWSLSSVLVADGQSKGGVEYQRIKELLDWFSDSISRDSLLCEAAYMVCVA